MPLTDFDMKDICDAYGNITKPVNFMDLDLAEEKEEEYGWWNPYAVYNPDDD